eukprot:scaffold536_cov250-Pinguiococcus_pyrenoidosus.AAC.12
MLRTGVLAPLRRAGAMRVCVDTEVAQAFSVASKSSSVAAEFESLESEVRVDPEVGCGAWRAVLKSSECVLRRCLRAVPLKRDDKLRRPAVFLRLVNVADVGKSDGKTHRMTDSQT